MKACGIIVEYNPLHNGHIYHINKTKELSKCDLLIAVMSGDFVQRGEPALVNKHLRTHLALLSGVDVVVLLPYLYAVSNADLFAFGAIKILSALGVNEIYFGSETNDVNLLKKIATTLESTVHDTLLKENMANGLSYAKANHLALEQQIGSDIIESNDLLGVQYIKNIIKIDKDISFHTIKRIHTNYNDESFTHDTLASATSIRQALFKNKDVKNYLPPYTFELLQKNPLVQFNDFYTQLKYQIIANQAKLHTIYDMNEGLENAILNQINNHNNLDDMISSLVSKRYTKSKIKRVLTHILMNVTKDDTIRLKLTEGPQFIQVLGINQNKSHLFKELKSNCPLPVITNINKNNIHLLELDLKVSSIYHMIDNKKERKIPIII